MKTIIYPSRQEWASIAQRPAVRAADLSEIVKAIFDEVRLEGDIAVQRYTKRFDGVELPTIVLSKSEQRRAIKNLSPSSKQAIDQAYETIQKFALTQKPLTEQPVETVAGVVCWREPRAIEKVGLYIPGGSAPLVSTVLMLGIPAQIAGCREIVLTTPPNGDGEVTPEICYAAQKVGVTTLVQVGGVQAIAALTFGTNSISSVDKIFGPGNQYVVAAKQYAQQFGVAIDMPAGPSEVMVVADESANPRFVAADLLSQAEHGPDSQVMLVTTSKTLADEVRREITKQVALLPRRDIAEQAIANSKIVIVDTLTTAIEFANEYAPEHLILSIKNAKALTKKITNAGSVFLGNYSPESAGDYASGTNHTLPTNGWAKSYSGLSVTDFVKMVQFQRLTKQGLKTLAPTIEVLAGAEGLDAHARAATIRFKRRD